MAFAVLSRKDTKHSREGEAKENEKENEMKNENETENEKEKANEKERKNWLEE